LGYSNLNYMTGFAEWQFCVARHSRSNFIP